MPNFVNNLAPIDLSKSSSDPTAVNLPPSTISSSVNATIISYFEELTGNKDAAQMLASSVIYTSAQQGVDPIGLIQQFKDLPPNQLNSYLAAILNLNRVSTSLVGVQTQPKISKYVQRSIIP